MKISRTTKIYVVIAYRWGDDNNHSYLVGVTPRKYRAIDMAQKENDYRCGKYTCTVYETDCDWEWNTDRSHLREIKY